MSDAVSSATTRAQAKELGLTSYDTGVPCINGHLSPRATTSKKCRACSRGRAQEQYQHLRAHDRIKLLLKWVRKSANQRGIHFDLKPGDILVPATCPCCGVSLQFNEGTWKDNSPSLDRLDNDQGYIKTNIAIICWRCNHIKTDASAEELERVAAWVRKRQQRHVLH